MTFITPSSVPLKCTIVRWMNYLLLGLKHLTGVPTMKYDARHSIPITLHESTLMSSRIAHMMLNFSFPSGSNFLFLACSPWWWKWMFSSSSTVSCNTRHLNVQIPALKQQVATMTISEGDVHCSATSGSATGAPPTAGHAVTLIHTPLSLTLPSNCAALSSALTAGHLSAQQNLRMFQLSCTCSKFSLFVLLALRVAGRRPSS